MNDYNIYALLFWKMYFYNIHLLEFLFKSPN